MIFIVPLFISLCLVKPNQIYADYILSFTLSDLHFLKMMVHMSSIINKDCPNEFEIKNTVIKEFIKYGNKKGFTTNTQFAKGQIINTGKDSDYLHEIKFEASLFDLSPSTVLTISIFKDWTFMVSEAMEELIKKLLQTGHKQQNQSNPATKKFL